MYVITMATPAERNSLLKQILQEDPYFIPTDYVPGVDWDFFLNPMQWFRTEPTYSEVLTKLAKHPRMAHIEIYVPKTMSSTDFDLVYIGNNRYVIARSWEACTAFTPKQFIDQLKLQGLKIHTFAPVRPEGRFGREQLQRFLQKSQCKTHTNGMAMMSPTNMIMMRLDRPYPKINSRGRLI